MGAFSVAKMRRSSASSSGTDALPQPIVAASHAAFAAAAVSALSSHGNSSAATAKDLRRPAAAN